MWFVRMMITSGSIGFKWILASKMPMPTRMVGMAPMWSLTTEVSMFLKVNDFAVYIKVFWGFQVRGFYIIKQICSAESKYFRVSVEMVRGAVSHREVHMVNSSFPSSRSYNFLHLVHSEGGKIAVLSFVLVKGCLSLFPVELSILKEIQKYRTVFGIGQG